MYKPYLKLFSTQAILLYLIALLGISFSFWNYALQPLWIAWGIAEVGSFFILTYFFVRHWDNESPKRFLWKLFLTALAIRVVYVVAMCYYYYYQTGLPFEYEAADSLNYHKIALLLSRGIRAGKFGLVLRYLQTRFMGWSDCGYLTHLTIIYTIFGRNILVPRLIKALMSAYMCVSVYKLCQRTFDTRTAKTAAIIFMLMPTLIYYCGLHLKETEMLFFAVVALERFDYLIRSKRYTFWNIILPIFLVAMAFGYRTILGIVLLFSFFAFVLLSPKQIVATKAKKWLLAGVLAIGLVFLVTPIGKEMRIIARLNFKESTYQVEKYEKSGMKYYEYAQGKYMAPAIFVLPFSSMVNASNNNQKMTHGNTYCQNFLAFFAMWAIVVAIREKKWRDFSLIGAFTISYLVLIAFSFSFNSDRYHLAALPGILMMASYSMSHFHKKDLKFYYIYLALLLIGLFAWNYLKLSARGLL